jgi:hypothetical protein
MMIGDWGGGEEWGSGDGVGSDYEELITLINCIGSIDVHFFWDKFWT